MCRRKLHLKNFGLTSTFSNAEITQGKQLLIKHAGHVANNNMVFQKSYKANYSDNYSFLSLKRSRLLDCVCDHANFTATAFSGSTFQETVFRNCNFKNASVDFCLFYKCCLEAENEEKGIINANLGNSNIIESQIINLSILQSTVSNVLFENTMFHKAKIEYSAFENSVFKNCRFEKMELRNLNLEYVEFINPSFDDIVLPYAQIPYIFGILLYMRDNNGSLWISSTSNTKISVDEYFALLPSMIPYYLSEQEYFPAANIYIALNEYEKAFEMIMNGMKKAGYEKDFRMLKYFCKLAITNGWCNREKIKQLYSFVYNINNFEPMIEYERHNYYMHLGEFRKILIFHNDTLPTLHVHLHTNILSHEAEKVSFLLHTLDQILDTVKNDDIISSIELHHESPYELILIVIGAFSVLQTVAKGFSIIFEPVKDIQEIIINQQQIKLNQQEMKLNQEKIEKMNNIAKESRKNLQSQNIFVQGNIYFTNCQQNKLSQKK